MSGRESPTQADREPRGPARLWICLRLAASFLTLLPVGPRENVSSGLLAESFGLFPLVGFAIGAALAVEDRLLGCLFPVPLRSVLVIGSALLLTGALHVDGLADTADAMGGGPDRVRALEILRDSRIGVFGVVAVVVWLALEWSALASLGGTGRVAALYAACGLSRWAMLVTAWGMDYLRSSGAGSFIDASRESLNLRRASLITALALLPVLTWRIWFEVVIAAAIAVGARRFYRRWIGGITGDLLGAAGAVVEAAVMVAAAVHLVR